MKPRYSGFELNVNIYNGDNKALYCNTDVHRIKNKPEFIIHFNNVKFSPKISPGNSLSISKHP